MSTEDALAELESGAGTQFDAELVELFASLVREGHVQLRARPPMGEGA